MPALKDLAVEVGAGCVHSSAARNGRHAPSAAMITKTTKITIETEGMLVVRQGRTVMAWCSECHAEVEAMLCEETSVVQLLGGIHAGSLHVCRSRAARHRSAFRLSCSFPNPAKFSNSTFPSEGSPRRRRTMNRMNYAPIRAARFHRLAMVTRLIVHRLARACFVRRVRERRTLCVRGHKQPAVWHGGSRDRSLSRNRQSDARRHVQPGVGTGWPPL